MANLVLEPNVSNMLGVLRQATSRWDNATMPKPPHPPAPSPPEDEKGSKNYKSRNHLPILSLRRMQIEVTPNPTITPLPPLGS